MPNYEGGLGVKDLNLLIWTCNQSGIGVSLMTNIHYGMSFCVADMEGLIPILMIFLVFESLPYGGVICGSWIPWRWFGFEILFVGVLEVAVTLCAGMILCWVKLAWRICSHVYFRTLGRRILWFLICGVWVVDRESGFGGAKYKNLGGEIMKMKHTCFCYVHFLLRSGLQYIDCLVYVWCSIIRYIYSHYIQHGLFFTGQKLKAFTRCYLARWLLVYMAT